MQNKVLRAVFYIFSRLAVVALIIAVAVGAFYSSMKTSNVYFLLNDALKARLDIILLGSDVEDKSRFFSYNYLQTREYESLKTKYGLYNITNYGHKLEYDNLFVWPWQKTKTVTVKEAVYAINGELDTAQMSKADAMAMDVYNIPQWSASIYKVKLINENGVWMIESIVRKGDYDYQPPRTPSLSEEEKDALRTPSPEPTATPDPNNVTGERMAVISNPIQGDEVNLREGPATEYDIIEKLYTGDKVTVKEESDGWYLIVTQKGNEGYVSGYYILFE